MSNVVSKIKEFEIVVRPLIWTDLKSATSTEWVDIRNNLIRFEERIPTRNGVMLQRSEYRMILPWLHNHKTMSIQRTSSHQPIGDSNMSSANNARRVSLKKNVEKPDMFDIILYKPNQFPSRISLTFAEIEELWDTRDIIENYFPNK